MAGLQKLHSSPLVPRKSFSAGMRPLWNGFTREYTGMLRAMSIARTRFLPLAVVQIRFCTAELALLTRGQVVPTLGRGRERCTQALIQLFALNF